MTTKEKLNYVNTEIALKGETFKIVPFAENKFFISNLGRLYRAKQLSPAHKEGLCSFVEDQSIGGNVMFQTSIDGKRTKFYVKDVVASLFSNQDLSKMEVIVKGDRTNPSIDNLTYIPRKKAKPNWFITRFFQMKKASSPIKSKKSKYISLPEPSIQEWKDYLELRRNLGLNWNPHTGGAYKGHHKEIGGIRLCK